MSTVLENLRRAQEAGKISREDAEVAAEFYNNRYKVALDRHKGDAEAAKREIAEWLANDEAVKKEMAAWLAKIGARSQLNTADLAARAPAPESGKVLQAIVGAVVGSLAATAALFVLLHIVMSLVEGSGATRIRVPVKGVLAVLIAPIAGAVIGALIGWRFDARVASDTLQRFLNTAPMLDRAWIAWGGVWTSVLLVAFTLFDPFGRYSFGQWRSGDVMWLVVVWAGPIVGGWVVARLVRWIASGRRE